MSELHVGREFSIQGELLVNIEMTMIGSSFTSCASMPWCYLASMVPGKSLLGLCVS